MSFFKSLSAVAVLAAATSAANAAVSLAWVANPIPANAQTTGNASPNGKLPSAGVGRMWMSYDLVITLTGGDKFGGGQFRAQLPAGLSFYRYTFWDSDGYFQESNIAPLGNVSAANPARVLGTGVAYPGANNFSTIGQTASILGGLNADGTAGTAADFNAPLGLDGIGQASDQLFNPIWGNPSPAAYADGSYKIARLTWNSDWYFPTIGFGSKINTILASGGSGPSIGIPPMIPEPTMDFALAGLGLLGRRRRK